MFKTIIASIFAMLLLQSCYVTKFKIDPEMKRSEPKGESDHQEWHHFFLAGLVPNVQYDATEVCKDLGGVAFVETKLTALNKLVNYITLSIYSPSTTKVYCVDSQK